MRDQATCGDSHLILIEGPSDLSNSMEATKSDKENMKKTPTRTGVALCKYFYI